MKSYGQVHTEIHALISALDGDE